MEFIIGDALGRIGVFRAIVTILFWAALSAVSYRFAQANIGTPAAAVAAVVVPLGLLAWAVRSPVTSRLSFWIVESLYISARLAMWVALFVLAWLLVEEDFSIVAWLPAWPVMLAAGGAWGLQFGIREWLQRSHDLAGDRSVVPG